MKHRLFLGNKHSMVDWRLITCIPMAFYLTSRIVHKDIKNEDSFKKFTGYGDYRISAHEYSLGGYPGMDFCACIRISCFCEREFIRDKNHQIHSD